jgi:uncharacterized protein YndB with AHSA1/START domain
VIDISRFQPTTIYTIYIAATPEKVWQALTRPEFTRQYFFGNSVEVDQSIGGAYVLRQGDGSIHISGEVVALDMESYHPDAGMTAGDITFRCDFPGT